MKTSKALTALLLSAVFCLSAAACAGDTLPADTAAKDTTLSDATAPSDTAAPPITDPDDDELLPTPDYDVAEPESPLRIYVTAGADDQTADGSEEHPYGTLEAGRDAARVADKSGHDSVDVIISGRFYRTDTFTLTKEDSGTPDCRIRYIGKDAEITGGAAIPLSDFSPVTDPEYLSCFNDEAKGKILTVDLKKYGVKPEDVAFSDITSYSRDGINSPFAGNTRLEIARYPDGKYISLGNVEKNVEGENITFSIKYTEIHNNHINNWHDPEHVYMAGFFSAYWSASRARILSFDTENAKMTIGNTDVHEPRKGMVYYWYNIPEELDTEGEYYLTEDAVLYYYPISGSENEPVYYPILRKNLLVSDADYVTFRDIALEDTCASACNINGDHVDLLDSSILRMGKNGIDIAGNCNRVMNCEVGYIAESGVSISGGVAADMVMANSLAYNNYVHDYSQMRVTTNGGFGVFGCGVTVSHNEACHANHLAVYYSGPCHLIEYNEFYDVLNCADDVGVIYGGRNLASYGTVVRYNYIHDNGSPNINECGTNGIYFDDGISGQTAYGNVIVNQVGFGFLVGGGSDHRIHDNIVINSIIAMLYDQRFYDQSKEIYPYHDLYGAVSEMLDGDSAYAKAFPDLKNQNKVLDLDDEWYWAVPARSIVRNNYAYLEDPNPYYTSYEIYNITDAVLRFSKVEDNFSESYSAGNQPTPEEAIAKSGLEIPFSEMGRP